MGAGGSALSIKSKAGYSVKSVGRKNGSGITPEVYQSQAVRPTEVLRNIRIAKSRLPKKYITFE
jgi:hypothetical protein